MMRSDESRALDEVVVREEEFELTLVLELGLSLDRSEEPQIDEKDKVLVGDEDSHSDRTIPMPPGKQGHILCSWPSV